MSSTSVQTRMRRTDVDTVVESLSAMFAGDGAALRLTGLDEQAGSVGLALSFDGVDCEDCVLPPGRIREVIQARLTAEVPGFSALDLVDPREKVEVPAARTAARPGLLQVLDPTAGAVTGDPDPGPPVGALRGKRVGFRVDVLWPAWDYAVEEWARRFEEAGAVVTYWRRAQGVKGAEGQRLQAEYDAFVGGVDLIISGLGNCGSCTSWSVFDALSGLNSGLPAVVGVTEEFTLLAQTLATDRGRPGLRQIVLPHSLQTLPEEQVRKAAVDAWPTLLETLGAVL